MARGSHPLKRVVTCVFGLPTERGQTKISGWAKLKHFETGGGQKVYPDISIVFVIYNFCQFLKSGGSNCALIPSPSHATGGHWRHVAWRQIITTRACSLNVLHLWQKGLFYELILCFTQGRRKHFKVPPPRRKLLFLFWGLTINSEQVRCMVGRRGTLAPPEGLLS